MIENSLNKIQGIEIFPIISLLIFISFFIVLVIWIIKIDKKYLSDMSQLPLDNFNRNELNSNGKYYEK
jgi:cytochrome c oxidase cbb3-type subunit IV